MDSPDIVSGAIAWSHGVSRGDLVVKHIERVRLGGCGTGFSFGITGTIVV